MTLGERLADARAFAVRAHADQRYGDQPYVVHLDAVRSVAVEHGVTDADVLVATLLHDVVEDTGVSREDVTRAFGERVADLVDAVSDPPEHLSREAKKKAAYPRIRAVDGAVVLKLADRLANVRACAGDGARQARKLAMYRGEHPGFRAALHPGEVALAQDPAQAALWRSLDALLVP